MVLLHDDLLGWSHVTGYCVGLQDPGAENPTGRDAPQEDDGASTWRGTTAALPSRVWDEWSKVRAGDQAHTFRQVNNVSKGGAET